MYAMSWFNMAKVEGSTSVLEAAPALAALHSPHSRPGYTHVAHRHITLGNTLPICATNLCFSRDVISRITHTEQMMTP